MDVLQNLMGPKADEPQLWTCEPLVAVRDGVDVVYSGIAVVEFQPNPEEPRTGRALVRKLEGPGEVPDLDVIDIVARPVPIDPNLQKKNGITVVGNAADGTPYTWYLGASGDDVILNGLP